MSARIAIIDIERQSALVDGVWDCRKRRYIHPDNVIEPARTICFAYKWADEDDIHFVAEWSFRGRQNNHSVAPGGGHRKMIEVAHAVLDEADYVVGWNSKSFDVKHLKDSFWAYGLTPPSPHVDIDLMLQSAGNFDPMSLRLDYVSRMYMGAEKLDVSGRLWRTLRFARGAELAEARERMEAYNVRDVAVTAAMYDDLLPWLKGLNVPLLDDTVDDDDPRCVNCGSDQLQRRGWSAARSRRYRRYQCQDCGKWNKGRSSDSHVPQLVSA